MTHADPVEAQRYNREYKRRNRWRYRASQKAWDAAKHANARAKAQGVPGTITPDEAREVLERGSCTWCAVVVEYLDAVIDHVVALSKGGPNVVANLACSCDPCNRRKAASDHPAMWSTHHEACVACGGTERKHASGGLCTRCYQRRKKS